VNLYSLFVYIEHNGDESPKARKKYLLYMWKMKKVNSAKKNTGVRYKLPQTIIEFQLLQITAVSNSVTIRSAEALL